MKLSYSTHGLPGDLFELINEFEKVGYAGVELAFQENQLDPREMTLEEIPTHPFILKIKEHFKNKAIKPACINTATLPLIPGRLHEPTVISLEEPGRQLRIDIIKKGIAIAKVIGAPIVGFGSGFIREEHINNPSVDPYALMLDSIQECLKSIGDSDVTLVIEPEPGMLIETLEQGVKLVEEIDSPHFKLHMDLCHAYCSEDNYVDEIEKSAPYTRYLHLSDTGDGYNLKIVNADENMSLDLDFAAYFLHFPENGDFLLLDKENAIYFYNEPLSASEKSSVESLVCSVNGLEVVEYLDINYINNLKRTEDYAEKQKEIKTFLLSMPRIAYKTLDKANPLLHYLRRTVIKKMVANSLTGKVHYHDIPGNGKIDFSKVMKVLNENNFTGYGTLELYHHGEEWREALQESKRYLDAIGN